MLQALPVTPRSASPLSAMEVAVLHGLATGLQSKELASVLKRSKPTVELYVRTLFNKFNAKSRAHLVALAIHEGVIETRTIAGMLRAG